MIIDTKGMRQIEEDSQIPVSDLMFTAGSAAAEALRGVLRHDDRILILIGNGNNGGDGSVICSILRNDYKVKIVPVCGTPKTDAAKAAWKKVPAGARVPFKKLEEAMKDADVIIDCIYGFGYHGDLKDGIRPVFRMVNNSGARVYSIDINSGAEADTGYFDRDAIVSETTFALDCYKPFHMLRRDHRLFKNVELLPLGLPHNIRSRYHEMNEEIFFSRFPRRPETAYKGTYGKTMLCGGCYGMAGALSLNITGARTVGAPYIEAVLPESIYPIVAMKHTAAVFHPFGYNTAQQVLDSVLPHAKAVAFGSGAVYMDRKQECMDLILQKAAGPVVIDAEGLRMLKYNTYLMRFVRCPVILTPHIGEFSALISKPAESIMKHRIEYALEFAAEHKVFLVLKGPDTIVVSPGGEVYINQSGNPALATAGSGDLLTGMIAAMCTLNPDVFEAVTMAVWLHGYLADLGREEYAAELFDLESYPALMNRLLKKHGF